MIPNNKVNIYIVILFKDNEIENEKIVLRWKESTIWQKQCLKKVDKIQDVYLQKMHTIKRQQKYTGLIITSTIQTYQLKVCSLVENYSNGSQQLLSVRIWELFHTREHMKIMAEDVIGHSLGLSTVI